MSRAGAPNEVGAYTTSHERRVLVAQRVNGRVALSDQPADPNTGGRVYLVERHVENVAELEGLVNAYTADSIARDEPAARPARDIVEVPDA